MAVGVTAPHHVAQFLGNDFLDEFRRPIGRQWGQFNIGQRITTIGLPVINMSGPLPRSEPSSQAREVAFRTAHEQLSTEWRAVNGVFPDRRAPLAHIPGQLSSSTLQMATAPTPTHFAHLRQVARNRRESPPAAGSQSPRSRLPSRAGTYRGLSARLFARLVPGLHVPIPAPPHFLVNYPVASQPSRPA